MADNGDLGSFVFRLVAGRSGGGDGQESGDDELEKKSEISNLFQYNMEMPDSGGKRRMGKSSRYSCLVFTSFMLILADELNN